MRGKEKQMKVKDYNWIVVVGTPIFTCKTRKQAREYAKKNKATYPQYNYIGKCTNNFTKIILDV